MTTGAQRDETDPKFVENLRRKRYYERRTAAWLDASGRASVTHPPLRIRGLDDDPRQFKDDGDLYVRLLPCEDPGDHQVVSVKRHDKDFYGRYDFPLPSIGIGDDTDYPGKFGVPGRLDLPLAIFAWNRGGTHFAIVYTEKSEEYWITRPYLRRGKEVTGVDCPLEHVSTWVHDETPQPMRRAWHCAGTEDAFWAEQAYERSARDPL